MKIGKIALRQVPKTRKSKKQSFALERNSEKRKNTSSHRSESSKIRKIELRSGAKHRKLKKHLFAPERKLKNQKSNISRQSEASKYISSLTFKYYGNKTASQRTPPKHGAPQLRRTRVDNEQGGEYRQNQTTSSINKNY